MKGIIFIDTQKSGSSREAIQAAEKLGYYTVLFTDRDTFLEKREEFPDVHFMQKCNMNSMEDMKERAGMLIAKGIDICGVTSMVDPYCYTACLLAKELNINRFSENSVYLMDNKILSKNAIENTPHCAFYTKITNKHGLNKEEAESRLPLILKSPLSSGSKDVYKVESYKEFKKIVHKLRDKYPKESILAEEYLDGPQYIVEAVMYKEDLYIIAIIRQDITYINGHFIITGYTLVIDMDKNMYEELKEATKAVIDCHGLTNGPCHLEMRYVKGVWKLIEINPRMSGAGMNKLINYGYGLNLAMETVKLSLGLKPDFSNEYEKHVYAKYIVLNERGTLVKVTGRNKALNSKGVKEVYIKPRKGALITPPVSMGNRYAYIIAEGDSEEEAKANAENASELIEFKLITVTEENTPEEMKE